MDNTFNNKNIIISDPNTFSIDTINIEFLKSIEKEVNIELPNKSYTFYPLYGTNDIYPKIEFNRKDSVGYIKQKNSSKWFYDDEVDFDYLKQSLFTVKRPRVVWFTYPREGEFIVQKYIGQNIEGVMKIDNNTLYLVYSHNGLKWSSNINDATKFVFDKIKWSSFSWIKLTKNNI